MTDDEKVTLLEEIKSFLNFTWTDEARTKRIENYMLSSDQYLCEVAGVETLDYSKDYLAKDLLFNRVLYADSQGLADFHENYNQMLNELKVKYNEQDKQGV